MKNKLQKHFPMIRTKGEALEAIKNNKKLWGIFCSWKEEYQQEYLDVCTGVRVSAGCPSALGSGD